MLVITPISLLFVSIAGWHLQNTQRTNNKTTGLDFIVEGFFLSLIHMNNKDIKTIALNPMQSKFKNLSLCEINHWNHSYVYRIQCKKIFIDTWCLHNERDTKKRGYFH